MFCPNCGADAGNSKFCPNCGTRLSQPTAQPGQTQAAQTQQPQAQPVQAQAVQAQSVQAQAVQAQTQYVQQQQQARPVYQNYAQAQQQYAASQNGQYNVNPYSAQGYNGAYNTQYAGAQGYTGQGAVVEDFNLFTAYGSMLKKYAKFSGRSRRKEYWLAVIMNAIIMMILNIAISILAGPSLTEMVLYERVPEFSLPVIILSIVYLVYTLVMIIPSLAILVRRFHDTGKSGAAILLYLIPFVGGLIVFIFTVLDSTPGPNQYGPNPKGVLR